MYNRTGSGVQQKFYTHMRRENPSGQRLQFVDHARYDRQPAVPEFRIPGVEAEWLEQFRIMLGAAGRQHRQIALGKACLRVFVGAVERVHEAIAERIGVDIKRRVDEVGDVHPEIFVTGADIDRRPETFALHAEPDFADAAGGQFAVLAFGVDGALESIKSDLAYHGIDHVLDLAGKQRLALPDAP